MRKTTLLLKRLMRAALLVLLLSVAGMTKSLAQVTQTTTFAQGWNWWNTYIEQDDIDGLGMLEEALGSNGSVIKTQCDGYAINIPNVGWRGNLQGLNNESTYMIRTESDCTVNMTGDEAVPSNHPITLYPGWTWIGFPNNEAMGIGNAVSNMTPSNGDQVRSQNAFTTYYSGMWIGGLNIITPGMGLQFKSNNNGNTTLVYPEGIRDAGQQRNITDNNHWTPNMHQYRDNMIVTGIVKLNGVEVQSDQYEVGAFVGDECRGSARPIYVQGLNRYVVFLTIEGESTNDQVSFKLYNYATGVELEGNSGLAFIADDAVGLPFDVPYEFGFTGMTTYVVTTEANPTAGGIVTGTGNYIEGATCTLTATANTGYTFINWTEDGEVVSTNAMYSFTVTEAGDYVANFTISVPSDAPIGAINGVFSVGDSTQVYFSQGNLQYIGSAATPYWKFADNQWDIIGSSQANTQQTTDRDLFCWGTSGYDHGANQYQPWSYLGPNSDYYAYGDEENNLFDGDGRADWGYNAISNGGNTENIGWRTLTEEEWLYLFNTRNTVSGIRFVRATVNDVGGIIFLPDNWNADTYELNETNNLDGSINNNIISAEDWVATFEANGAVFLPIAGWMQMDNGGYYYSNPGAYWSSTVLNANTAWYYDVYYYYNGYGSGHLIEFTDHHDRGNKRSVRLAINTNASPLTGYTINATANPAEGGTVTGAGIYELGSICTLTATANEGYTFINWTKDGSVVSTSNPYTFTVTENGAYVANFELADNDPLLYSINADGVSVTVTGHVDGTAATGSITIPETKTINGVTYAVTAISVSAFYNCAGLTGDLVIPNSVTTIANYAFYGCSGFTGSLSIPNSVTEIGNYAFCGCSGFTGNLSIPNSVTEIGNYAFGGCSGFTGSLSIPNSVTEIGEYAFSGCSGFTGSLTIGNSVTTIGYRAFEECIGFTGDLTIGNSVTTIGRYAFWYCSGFTGSLAIPNSVTTIGEGAFWYCSGFTGSLTIGNSVTTIGKYAFQDCSGFTGSLTIGNSVTTIGLRAFRYCSGFTSMTVLAENPPTIYSGGFYDVNHSIPVTVPCGSLNAYQSTDWSSFTNMVEDCGGGSSQYLPLTENFDGASLPAGWSIDAQSSNWSVSPTMNAGGSPNEMWLTWTPQFNGVTRLVSPAVNLTGVNSVMFSFKHCLNNYSGSNTIGIATSSDGGTTWNTGWSQGYSSSGTWSLTQEIVTPDMGQPNVQFCIFFNGNSYNINDWFFDDIMIFVPKELDLGISQIHVADYLGAGSNEVEMVVSNFGLTTVTSVEATYEIAGMTHTETFAVNIPSMGSATLGFATPMMLSPGQYNLAIALNSVNGSADETPENDTLSKSVSVALTLADRIPMIEHFSSSTCGPCVQTNVNMHTFCENNAGRFTYTKYQMNWPGNGDPYYTAEGGVRRNYYDCNGVPQIYLDGTNQANLAITQNTFDQFAEEAAFVDLRGSFTVNGNVIDVAVDVMPYVDVETNLFVSVNEKETHGNVGSNGETAFYHIFMKMLTSADGDPISLSAGEAQHFEFTQNLSSTHVEEMTDLEVAIWLQDYPTHEVLNSRFAYEYTTHPYPVNNLALTQSGASLTATWAAPIAGNPVGYNVYVNGELAAENIANMVYAIPINPGDSYTVGVQALYANGKTSVQKVVFFESENALQITATANPTEGGTVSGAGYYTEGATCTLTATANEGYTFTNWTKEGVEVSTDATLSFTVTESASYVANFTEAASDFHWDVNVSTYPNTMTMIGVIVINGEEQMTTSLEIGTFCGDECRGRERLVDTYYQAFGHYFVFLTVYGNDGDQISFRLYDHAIGQELDLTCSPLAFQTNGLFGNPGTPYVFDFGPSQITQSTNITSGWNWWSTYVEADNLFAQLKTGLGDNAQQIKSSTVFVNYFNGLWIGGLNSISNESCYLINANNACTVEMTGNQAAPDNHPITINPNWNWIGYPNTTAQSVANAFSNFTPANGDQVKSQNAFATYYGNMWVGGLSTITPGMGLLYKSNSTSAKTLVYPEVSRSEELVENVINENSHWTANYHAYPSNMTVMAVVELDDVELQSENYEVAAFADGECHGSARLMYVAPINRYVAFLTIVGDEASELRFSLYDSEMGTVIETCQGASLQYETNAIVGSLETPYVIRFRGTTGVDEWSRNINIFPNPVNRGEQFSLGLTAVETLRATSVQIVNAMGIVVETWRAASLQTITAPNVAGVYTLRITVEGKGVCFRKLVVR